MQQVLYKNIRILSVHDDYFIAAKGYKLFKYDLLTGQKNFYAWVKDFNYSMFSKFSLTRRLLRAEITNLYDLPNGTQLCIAKKGIFRRGKNCKSFVKCFDIPRGSRPMNLCIDDKGSIYFGEYFANKDKESVHIYSSKDCGVTWQIVYTFEQGSINHIHGLFWDLYTKSIWVCTGDLDNECIIGYSQDGFKTFNVVFRGGQEFRSCNMFFYKTYVVFATDSQYINNYIASFDRSSLNVVKVQDIQGSAIKGGGNGKYIFLSTTVEPSVINLDNYSHLWISKDGLHWNEIYKDCKDKLPALFQFGSIEFPNYYTISEYNELFFSGRALKNIGGSSVLIKI